jgi:UDP-glucose 4-epimerase
MSMKILITGSSGFIGKHLVAALQSQGHDIVQADRTHGIDLTDQAQVQALPEVEMVVHLAAHNGTRHFYERPLDVIRDAVLPTQYLIDRYLGRVQRFVFTGTCESYAGAVDLFDWPLPTDETVPLVVADVTNPRWSYGGSKIVNELQVTAAWSQHGMPYSIIRYHNVYGPGQRDHFIPEFWERAKTGDLSLRGWENTRSFMYVSDAIDATIGVMSSAACQNQIVNIGVDDEISIRDLAQIILEEAGIRGDLVLEPAPEGSVRRRCGDVSKLHGLLDFRATVDIRSGIRQTLASYA